MNMNVVNLRNRLVGVAIAAAIFAVSSQCAFAGTSNGLVTNIWVHSGGGTNGDGVVLFTIAGAKSGKPACDTVIRYAADLGRPFGQATLSRLLAAQVSGDTVRVTGSNTCTIFGGTENVTTTYN